MPKEHEVPTVFSPGLEERIIIVLKTRMSLPLQDLIAISTFHSEKIQR